MLYTELAIIIALILNVRSAFVDQTQGQALAMSRAARLFPSKKRQASRNVLGAMILSLVLEVGSPFRLPGAATMEWTPRFDVLEVVAIGVIVVCLVAAAAVWYALW